MISFLANRILSFTGGTINAAKRQAKDMTHLVRQGQEEVIEEDSGGRNRIILITITRSKS